MRDVASRTEPEAGAGFLAGMNVPCLLGRHWPLAAYAPFRPGFQLSRCTDCGRPMMKADGVDWMPLPAALTRRVAARAQDTRVQSR